MSKQFDPFYLDVDCPLYQAECVLIGALLAEPDDMDEVTKLVDDGNFLHCGLLVLFQTMVQMWVMGEKIDVAEVYERHTEVVEQLGGPSRLAYLLQCASDVGPRRAAISMLAAYDQTCAELRDREGK